MEPYVQMSVCPWGKGCVWKNNCYWHTTITGYMYFGQDGGEGYAGKTEEGTV